MTKTESVNSLLVSLHIKADFVTSVQVSIALHIISSVGKVEHFLRKSNPLSSLDIRDGMRPASINHIYEIRKLHSRWSLRSCCLHIKNFAFEFLWGGAREGLHGCSEVRLLARSLAPQEQREQRARASGSAFDTVETQAQTKNICWDGWRASLQQRDYKTVVRYASAS